MSSGKTDEIFPSKTVSCSLGDFKEYPMGLFPGGREANEGHLLLDNVIKGLMQLPVDSLCYTKYFFACLDCQVAETSHSGMLMSGSRIASAQISCNSSGSGHRPGDLKGLCHSTIISIS